MHGCTGARGAEIPCHSTLRRWSGLFGRCCRLSRPWCPQGEQVIDDVGSRNGRLPKVTARADAGSSKASSGSLLHSSQVPFPPCSPGPCHLLRSHDCWWIFFSGCGHKLLCKLTPMLMVARGLGRHAGLVHASGAFAPCGGLLLQCAHCRSAARAELHERCC